MNNRFPSFRKRLLAPLFLALAPFTLAEMAPTEVDAPVTEQIEAGTDISVVAPTNTFHGTRGLSQTSSAEALGEGRLIFGIQGGWYGQRKAFLGGPNTDANIFTGIGVASLGVNRHVDVFATLAGFGSTDYVSNRASGLGSVGGGVQGTLPFAPSAPVRMGAQVGIHQGLSDNPVNANGADGYNYFETRTGLDFTARLIQTLVLGEENLAFKLHFNEGLVTSAEDGTEPILMLATGAQVNLYSAALGLELNSRTAIAEIAPSTDPLWLTPSVQLRTAYDINVTLGGDIALSQGRDGTPARALEPYRLFAGMAFTFDTEYNKRMREKDKARFAAQEKRKLRSDNQALAADLVEQSRADSLARLRQKESSDSSAAAVADRNRQDSLRMTGQSRQDSLRMAGRASQDSLALAESRRKLAEEKSKRTDAEKQLLSTGLLIMDAVYFETNRTAISINSKPYLNIMAKMLTKYPKLRIEIAGHTDDVGSDAANQSLSQHRAEAVASYMGQSAPELGGMLTARGYGESLPKSGNQSAEGRKLNRRTELQVLNKEALKEYNP